MLPSGCQSGGYAFLQARNPTAVFVEAVPFLVGGIEPAGPSGRVDRHLHRHNAIGWQRRRAMKLMEVLSNKTRDEVDALGRRVTWEERVMV